MRRRLPAKPWHCVIHARYKIKPSAGVAATGEDVKRKSLRLGGLGLAAALIGTGFCLHAPDLPRAALESRYAAPPSIFLRVAGIRLHIRDTGPKNARAIILLHGFGASLHSWDALSAILQSDRRVIRFDLPGFGLTGADPTGNYTDARSMAVLEALMDHLGIATASLAGNSMGGRIAWRFAALHPDRVDRLVLISPDGFASPGLAYGVAPKIPVLVRLLPTVLPNAMVRSFLAPAYGNPSFLTDDHLKLYRDMMLAPGVRGAIVTRMSQQILVDPVPILKGIRTPTLLLWGEKDAMIPISNAADYEHAMSHAELVRLPGLGHLPQEEDPARTAAAIHRFLAP